MFLYVLKWLFIQKLGPRKNKILGFNGNFMYSYGRMNWQNMSSPSLVQILLPTLSSVAKHPQKGRPMGASNSHATAYKGKGTWNTLKASTRLRFESYATVPSMVHPLHSSPSVRPTSPHGPDVTSTHIYRLSILNYRIL